MAYRIREIFYSLQGEGAHAGCAAAFIRFAGCNLWSGRERDRKSAVCKFCDTDFLGTEGPGGGRFESACDLAQAALRCWNEHVRDESAPFVVCTGGEPLLQLDQEAIEAFHEVGCFIAVETNGTLPAPRGIDWLCVSPKAGTDLVLRAGNELKLVYPQDGAEPGEYEDLRFDHFFLQPMSGPDVEENTRLALNYCLAHPKWRLSLQVQKILGIP